MTLVLKKYGVLSGLVPMVSGVLCVFVSRNVNVLYCVFLVLRVYHVLDAFGFKSL